MSAQTTDRHTAQPSPSFDPRLSLHLDRVHADLGEHPHWLRRWLVDVERRICERQILAAALVWPKETMR